MTEVKTKRCAHCKEQKPFEDFYYIRTKRCAHCKERKLFEDFYYISGGSKPPYHTPRCKECEKDYQRQKYRERGRSGRTPAGGLKE